MKHPPPLPLFVFSGGPPNSPTNQPPSPAPEASAAIETAAADRASKNWREKPDGKKGDLLFRGKGGNFVQLKNFPTLQGENGEGVGDRGSGDDWFCDTLGPPETQVGGRRPITPLPVEKGETTPKSHTCPNEQDLSRSGSAHSCSF